MTPEVAKKLAELRKQARDHSIVDKKVFRSLQNIHKKLREEKERERKKDVIRHSAKNRLL